jgi:hypothetical protein
LYQTSCGATGTGPAAATGSEQRRAHVSDGSGARGGPRREQHYCNALSGAREAGTCLDVAQALGYLGAVDGVLLGGLDKVRATLVARLVR